MNKYISHPELIHSQKLLLKQETFFLQITIEIYQLAKKFVSTMNRPNHTALVPLRFVKKSPKQFNKVESPEM